MSKSKKRAGGFVKSKKPPVTCEKVNIGCKLDAQKGVPIFLHNCVVCLHSNRGFLNLISKAAAVC
jgi:cytochrome c